MRLAQNITRVAARNVSSSTNNTSLTARQTSIRKKESTAVKSITTPKDIRIAIKYPSACSGVAFSDRVAIDGASNLVVSCFSGAVSLKSSQADIPGQLKEDQGEHSAQTEQPNKVSQKPPTGDDISLRWDTTPAGEDDTPLSPKLSLENFHDYCFETPPPKVAMMRTPLFPPPPPRPDHAMIYCIRHPIPEELLVPVF
jgi:hypothetical protein